MDHPRINPDSKAPQWGRDLAFTMIEMVVALAISAMLLIAIGGAVTLASRALPSRSDVNREQSLAAEVARTIAIDLRYANAFSELTADAVTFTVADRDNDGNDETIRYECLGTPDSPAALTRSINGGAAVSLLDDVRGFAFDFGTYTMTEPGPLVLSESEEELLFDEQQTGGASSSYSVFDIDWIGQRFNLAAGDSIVSWRISRAKLLIDKKGNSNGVMKIQLRTADVNGLPTTQIIDEVSFAESNGSGTALSEFSFSTAIDLSPNDDYCLVVIYESGTGAVGCVAFNNSSTATPTTQMVTSGSSESGWQNVANADLEYQIFGHRTGFFHSPATVSTTRLRWIGLTIEPDEEEQTHVTLQTPIHAQPEVVP